LHDAIGNESSDSLACLLAADRRQRLKRRRLLWEHSAGAETSQSPAQLFEGRDRLGKAAGSGLRGQARRRRQPRIRERRDQHSVGEFGRTKRRLRAPTAQFNADVIDRKKIELLTRHYFNRYSYTYFPPLEARAALPWCFPDGPIYLPVRRNYFPV
jgi:hypothetical protein